MEQMILTTITPEIFFQSIRSIVKDEIKAEALNDLQEKLLSPEETCKLFTPQITKPTLAAWTEAGHLTKYHLGGRVFYKYSEIMASLKTLARYKTKSQLATN